MKYQTLLQHLKEGITTNGLIFGINKNGELTILPTIPGVFSEIKISINELNLTDSEDIAAQIDDRLVNKCGLLSILAEWIRQTDKKPVEYSKEQIKFARRYIEDAVDEIDDDILEAKKHVESLDNKVLPYKTKSILPNVECKHTFLFVFPINRALLKGGLSNILSELAGEEILAKNEHVGWKVVALPILSWDIYECEERDFLDVDAKISGEELKEWHRLEEAYSIIEESSSQVTLYNLIDMKGK